MTPVVVRAYRFVNEIMRQTMPDPAEVLTHDLGLPADADDLARAQAAWCRRFGRDGLDAFLVHDAVHYLLDAPPTPMGEAAVVAFQVAHGLFDRNVVGGISIQVAGWILVARRAGRKFRRIASDRFAGAADRLAALRAEIPGDGVV